MLLDLLSIEHILSGIKSTAQHTSMMEHLAVAAVKEWRSAKNIKLRVLNRKRTSKNEEICNRMSSWTPHNRSYYHLHTWSSGLMWNSLINAAGRCQIFNSWWWKKALSGVFGLFNNGYPWMPTSLPWNTRILRRFKHEGGAANSTTLGQATSTIRSHGRREKRKLYQKLNAAFLSLRLEPRWLLSYSIFILCCQGHRHMSETKGLCLFEEQIVRTVWHSLIQVACFETSAEIEVLSLFYQQLQKSRRPRVGGCRIIDMFTKPYRLVRKCEVTAILVLYGLPR